MGLYPTLWCMRTHVYIPTCVHVMIYVPCEFREDGNQWQIENQNAQEHLAKLEGKARRHQTQNPQPAIPMFHPCDDT